MSYKRLTALFLSAAMCMGMWCFSVTAQTAPLVVAEQQILEQENEKKTASVTIQMRDSVEFGEPLDMVITTQPAGAQYLGLIIGTWGDTKGFVSIRLSQETRDVLESIPLPSWLTGGANNGYQYLKKMIDGCSLDELLSVAQSLADLASRIQIPNVVDLSNVSNQLSSVSGIVQMYITYSGETQVYLDEDPKIVGNYVAGAAIVDPRYEASTTFKMFNVNKKAVSLVWATDVDGLTLEQAYQTDCRALVRDGDRLMEADESITYQYKGWLGWLNFYSSEEFPTKAGTYKQIASIGGNYTGDSIERTIRIS